MSETSQVFFAGLRFVGLSRAGVLRLDRPLKVVATVNAEFIVRANRDESFRTFLNSCVLTFDGQLPMVLARIKNPAAKIEKISGSDLVYDILKEAKCTGARVFFLGGRELSNSSAVRVANELYGARTFGYAPPYAQYPFAEDQDREILRQIQAVGPTYLLVGFGARKQELWIRDHLDDLSAIGVRFVIGTGGTFEFVGGIIERAPIWVQNLGMEGVFRLLKEPSWFRLRRIFVSFGVFWYALRRQI